MLGMRGDFEGLPNRVETLPLCTAQNKTTVIGRSTSIYNYDVRLPTENGIKLVVQ